jgi:hypothetical protein
LKLEIGIKLDLFMGISSKKQVCMKEAINLIKRRLTTQSKFKDHLEHQSYHQLYHRNNNLVLKKEDFPLWEG